MPQPNRFVTARLTFRTGATSDWEEYDPVLLASEPAWDNTLGQLKIGDGASKWSEIEYTTKDGFLDPETPNEVFIDSGLLPVGVNTIAGAIAYSLAKTEALELSGVENFSAGLDSATPKFSVVITAGENGWVSLNSAIKTNSSKGIFDKDETVTITATADEGYEFDKWIGIGVEDHESAITTFTAIDNRIARATFKLPL